MTAYAALSEKPRSFFYLPPACHCYLPISLDKQTRIDLCPFAAEVGCDVGCVVGEVEGVVVGRAIVGGISKDRE